MISALTLSIATPDCAAAFAPAVWPKLMLVIGWKLGEHLKVIPMFLLSNVLSPPPPPQPATASAAARESPARNNALRRTMVCTYQQPRRARITRSKQLRGVLKRLERLVAGAVQLGAGLRR